MLGEIDKLGVRVDIVLNNAGLQIAYRNDYFSTPVSDYTESFLINTVAPAMICYHFMPKMIENGFGRIVNTTSGIALEPQQAGYSASKAALDKITIDKIKSLNISEEYVNNIQNIQIEEINTYTLESTKNIIKQIKKNIIDNEIKSMSYQIKELSSKLELLKKNNGNTKEVDEKIMNLSLEILKKEKIKKDL